MTRSRQHALVEARKLVRTFSSAPDARRRAQAVMSAVRHAGEWSEPAQREIAATEAWLASLPPLEMLPGNLRALLNVLDRS